MIQVASILELDLGRLRLRVILPVSQPYQLPRPTRSSQVSSRECKPKSPNCFLFALHRKSNQACSSVHGYCVEHYCQSSRQIEFALEETRKYQGMGICQLERKIVSHCTCWLSVNQCVGFVHLVFRDICGSPSSPSLPVCRDPRSRLLVDLLNMRIIHYVKVSSWLISCVTSLHLYPRIRASCKFQVPEVDWQFVPWQNGFDAISEILQSSEKLFCRCS